MPISTRPSLEDFINKGGSSSISFAEPAAKPARKKSETPRTKKSTAAQPAAPPPPAAASRQTSTARSVGRPRKVREADALKFVMRIPPQISDDMARVIESRKVPVSRNAWILEAIVEKLEKDAAGAVKN